MAFENPDIPDNQVAELVGLYRDVESDLALGYEDLLAEDDQGRFEAWQALLALLLLLTSRTRSWAERTITEYVRTENESILLQLSRLNPDARFDPGVLDRTRETAIRELLGNLYKARIILEQSIRRAYGAMDLSQTYPEVAQRVLARNPGLEGADLEKKIQRELAKEFRKKPVKIIGTDGRTYSFPLSYYAAMVAHAAKHQITSLLTVARATEAGIDLIQCSNNHSLHGDWCDAYRGKVFSIRGATPGFPRLDQLPNNGAPFHPWCRHTMRPFNPAGKSEEDLRQLGNVDERFLLGPQNDFNTMVRTWWASKR